MLYKCLWTVYVSVFIILPPTVQFDSKILKMKKAFLINLDKVNMV